MQMSRAARSSESHIKSGLKMEPHGVFKEVTKLCNDKDHQSVLHLHHSQDTARAREALARKATGGQDAGGWSIAGTGLPAAHRVRDVQTRQSQYQRSCCRCAHDRHRHQY